mgnify:CR=1 FL=1
MSCALDRVCPKDPAGLVRDLPEGATKAPSGQTSHQVVGETAASVSWTTARLKFLISRVLLESVTMQRRTSQTARDSTRCPTKGAKTETPVKFTCFESQGTVRAALFFCRLTVPVVAVVPAVLSDAVKVTRYRPARAIVIDPEAGVQVRPKLADVAKDAARIGRPVVRAAVPVVLSATISPK